MTKRHLYGSDARYVLALENEIRVARRELASVQIAEHSKSKIKMYVFFNWNKVIRELRKREAQILKSWSRSSATTPQVSIGAC